MMRIVAAGYDEKEEDPADLWSKTAKVIGHKTDAHFKNCHKELFGINHKNFASLSDMITRIAYLRHQMEEFEEPISDRSLIATILQGLAGHYTRDLGFVEYDYNKGGMTWS